MTKHKKKKKRYRLFFLHRYAGLSIAVFAIILSITGILLNHTEEFGLHEKNVTSPWLMGLYGIKAPEIKTAFSINNLNSVNNLNNDHLIIEFGDSLYLNNQSVDCQPPLNGAIKTKELLFIANQSQLCLLTPNIENTELIDTLSLPITNPINSIKRLGLDDKDNIVIDTTSGLLTINSEYTAFVDQKNTSTIKWGMARTVPKNIKNNLIKQHKGEGLPLERIILDLHSGRIVGLAGVYFMDLVALLLIFLAVSGVITWANRKKKKTNKITK